jgi:hypothetical protein
LEGDPF